MVNKCQKPMRRSSLASFSTLQRAWSSSTLGRFPVITSLNALDRVALKRILIEPKNALVKQYIALFKMDGITLTFTEDCLDYIVDKAVELQLGARGLRAIVEKIMTDAMFEFPSLNKKKIEVDEAYAKEKFESSIFSFKDK